MIYEILDIFKREYKEKQDKLILDNYQLKEGLYVKVNDDKKVEYFVLKKKSKDYFFMDLNGNIKTNEENWFKGRDYYSVYLNSNKSLYDKKIHNINYLTFFIKIDSFLSKDEKKRLKDTVIKGHYDTLSNFKKFNDKKEVEILKNYESFLFDKKRQEDIKKKYSILKELLPEIIKVAQANKVNNYVKIYFEADIEKYKRESEVYYAIKIFNDIKYSILLGNLTYGLSNSNMGLNSKKPFLENKTRKTQIPFYLTKENALLLKIFFDWLKFQENQDYFLNFFMRKHSKNDEAEIIDFDFIPIKNSDANKLLKPFILKNYLHIQVDKQLLEDEKIEYLNILEDKIDKILYNGQLRNNYYGEVYKKLTHSFANLIYLTRESMVLCFRKYNDKDFYKTIKKYASMFALEHIKNNNLIKASQTLNLKLSTLEYIGELVMDIKQIQENVLTKLEDDNYTSLTKVEFFYLCGQVARYLIGQSKTTNKTGDMLEPYLRANNAQKLKKVIESDFFKYKHSISLAYRKFNNAMSLIMAFSEKEKLSANDNMDSFLVGALSENIFYKN